MKIFKGSKTEQNLLKAFSEEAMAHNKYSYYASKAKKEGFLQISKIFEETAKNEIEHAKIWFKLLNNGEIPTTEENLKDCIKGERFEWSNIYLRFAHEAKEEGFDDIAILFEEVGKIEEEHEKRYKKLLENFKNNCLFKKNDEVIWECSNCGHIHIGKEAPDECSVCKHPKDYFIIKVINY